MKGVVVGTVVRYVRKALRDPEQAARMELGHEARALLYGTPIVPSRWYDYGLYLELMHAVFEGPLHGDHEALAGFAAAGARHVYGSVHRFLIRPGRPMETIRDVGVHWQTCHDFGRAQADAGDGEAHVHIHGATPMSEVEGTIDAGWIGGILASAGATAVQRSLVRRPWLPDGGDVLAIHYRWQ